VREFDPNETTREDLMIASGEATEEDLSGSADA
jgi:erythritol transport system ATP-binding protein